LLEVLGATKEAMTTIDQDREVSHGNISSHLFPPYRTKAKTPKEI